nr:hypothetical protein [Saccharothrix sp. NRRL B-16348]
MAKNGGKLAEAAQKAGKCVNSFTGDTPVLMADGSTKRIDQIKVDDEVANSEPDSERVESHVVLAVIVTDADKDYVDLTITTPDGPKRSRRLRTTRSTTRRLAYGRMQLTSEQAPCSPPQVTVEHPSPPSGTTRPRGAPTT